MISEAQFLKDFKEMFSTNEEIELNTDLLDIDEWDSFSAAAFLTMIKSKYGINVEPFAVAEAIFVEDLYDIVKANK